MNISYNKKKYKHHIQNFFDFNILATRITIGLCNISEYATINKSLKDIT